MARLLEYLREMLSDGVKLRFVLSGAANTAFGLGIYPVLLWLLQGLPCAYLIALLISQPTSIIFAYLTNKYFTFRTRRNILREFTKFSSFYLFNFAINLAFLPICVEMLHFPPIPSQYGFAAVVMATSYFWHSRVTFKQKTVRLVE